jgi:hypothetical protein
MSDGLQERSAWILMERIKIPVRKNFLIRDSTAQFGKVVSELGVYGTTISYAVVDLLILPDKPTETVRTL